jgi:hypothetical protein
MHPVAAQPTITVSGTLYDVTANFGTLQLPVAGASIDIVRSSDGSVLSTATTTSAGQFTESFTTNGVPVVFHNEIQASGFLPTRSYYNVAWAAGFSGWTIFTVAQSRMDQVAAALGVTADPNLGFVELAVDDCRGGGAEGATVTLSTRADPTWALETPQGAWTTGHVALAHGLGWSSSLFAAVNVPLGSATLTVSAGNTTYPPVTLDVAAGTWTWAYLTP